MRASGSCRTRRRSRVASAQRSSTSSSGSRASATTLGVSDNRYEIAVLDARTGAVVLDSRSPQETGSELGVPGDDRFRGLAGATGDGVRKLDDLRAVYRPLGVAADSENDWIVVASAPRVRAASLRRRQLAPDRARAARRPADRGRDGPALGANEQGSDHGRAHRSRQPPQARSPTSPTSFRSQPPSGRSRSCSAISTASSSTTTPSAIPPATRCSPGSATGSTRRSASPELRTGSAATSSALSRRLASKASPRWRR